ncbi:MAG: hypothetical protein KGM47_18345, partial [Acidobacteriota bacterium]|nr:hypothetical protein [Acidobacteriota bacterium]
MATTTTQLWRWRLPAVLLLIAAIVWSPVRSAAAMQAAPGASGPRFEISFSRSVHAAPITGRVYVMISPDDRPEPRFQAGNSADEPPFFGTDVDQLKPGASAVINSTTLGYPVRSLTDI